MLKRLFDIAITALLLMLLTPFIFIVYVLIRVKMGNPVLFKQIRPGLMGRSFVVYKFRTMSEQVDEEGKLLSDGIRLTGLGRLLRKSSLDETPQLINVLKGDMSLVGPRPLLMEYLPLYSKEQGRRHLIRPGITGWAQVNGRNTISWQDRFKLDVWYVDNVSLILDLKIILLTILKVFRRDDINAPNADTMEKFTGNK